MKKIIKDTLELISAAWVGVISHKLRSFLTILGIVIGVAAVIALMAIGKGSQEEIISRISTLGSNLITIRAGSMQFGGMRMSMGSASTLTYEDGMAIADEIENVEAVSPYSTSSMQVIYGSENMNTQIYGVTPEYATVYNWACTSGAFFTEYEYQRGSKVAVIGSEVVETLFPDNPNPVGEKIRLENNILHVIGVLESKGDSMSLSDDVILIPLGFFYCLHAYLLLSPLIREYLSFYHP